VILPKEKATEEGMDMKERVAKAGGRHNQGDRSKLHCTRCKNNGSHEADDCKFPWDKMKEDRPNKKQDKGKPSEPTKGNPPESTHYIVSHFNIVVTEDLFNTSYNPWKYG
jgi:hypothetical protein